MRRGSLRKAYTRGLVEPLARKIDQQEVDKQPYSRNTRCTKVWHATIGQMLREARDRLFHVKGTEDAT